MGEMFQQRGDIITWPNQRLHASGGDIVAFLDTAGGANNAPALRDQPCGQGPRTEPMTKGKESLFHALALPAFIANGSKENGPPKRMARQSRR
jgi:hypothetical protein